VENIQAKSLLGKNLRNIKPSLLKFEILVDGFSKGQEMRETSISFHLNKKNITASSAKKYEIL
jgi:hypothetical protein